ncbi:MAG: hypothetical protein NTY35_17535 [Planctomycetota bacterium]|nr:hypothetical protein [Planctomycetota bacterium]
MIHRFLAAAAAVVFGSVVFAQTNDRLAHLGESAPGTVSVTKTGSVYELRFTGDEVIRYTLDVGETTVARGGLRVYEASSDSWPLWDGGVGYRDGLGNALAPPWIAQYSVLTGQSMTTDSVVLDYTDTIPAPDSKILHRRHTFKLKGKTLRIQIEDLDARRTWARNYCGVYVGRTNATETPKYVLMQGSLLAPSTQFRDGAERWFLGSSLDLFQSNASDWTFFVQGHLSDASTSFRYTVDTFNQYDRQSNGMISGPLRDAIVLTVSSHLSDTLAIPTTPISPYRPLLEGRTMAILPGTNWADYTSLWNLFDQWGLHDLAGYFFIDWVDPSRKDPPLAPGVIFDQNAGPDWWPARNPVAFESNVNAGRAKGFLLGAYMAFNELPPTSPLYSASLAQRAQTDTGQIKKGEQTGFDSLAISACLEHAVREATLVEDDYGLNMAYLDIQSYASPSHGADGDHVDQRHTSRWARTLSRGIADQKSWMRRMTDIYEGPLVGEGSISSGSSSHEWLWAGYCDSVQRCINSSSGKNASEIPAGDPLAPTNWPVIPEFELRVMSRIQTNHGNGFPDRFFGPSDGSGIVNTSTGHAILPLTERALDRYRAYEITYGKASYLFVNGPYNGIGNYTWFADLIKEYYLVNALQTLAYESPVSTIDYLYNGTLQSFDAVFGATSSLDTFRNPRIRIVYQNGLSVWVNHSTTSWSVTAGGVTYSIPEDGYVAWKAATGGGQAFRSFSAIPSGVSARIDYCYAPGRWEYFDGRGVVNNYAGIDTQGIRRSRFVNFVTGSTAFETATDAIQVVPGAAPSVVRVDVLPATLNLSAGSRQGVRAMATYSNGAVRNVTTLVNWSTSNPNVGRINRGAALSASGTGTTTVQCTSYAGVACTPSTLTVP